MQEPSGPVAVLQEFPPAFPDLIPQVLPSSQVHVMAGAPAAGKTTYTAQITKVLDGGSVIHGYQSRRPAFIGVISADRKWSDHKQWYDKVGLVDIAHYSLLDAPGFKPGRFRDKEKRLEILEEALDRIGAVPDSFIHVDPLAMFLGGALNDYDTVAMHLFSLNRICMVRQITIFGNMHAGKQRGDAKVRYARPQDRVAGSTAISGFAGTTMYLATPTETEQFWHEFTWVPHHAASLTVRLTRDETTGLFMDVDPNLPTGEVEKGFEDQLQILGFFPEDGSPIHTNTLIYSAKQEFGFGQKRTRAALAQLRDEQRIKPGPEYGEWRRSLVPES